MRATGEWQGIDLGLRGQGTIDFAHMFKRLEGGGDRGHYMMALGSLDDMPPGANTW
jgi:hypothetical protein